MPGPYCQLGECLSQIQASQGSASLESYWTDRADRAVDRGYQRMVAVLAARGYGPAQLDAWSGRRTYNLAYAVAFAYRFGSFGSAYDEKANSDELRALDAELADPKFALVDDAGNFLAPRSGALGGRLSTAGYRINDDTVF